MRRNNLVLIILLFVDISLSAQVSFNPPQLTWSANETTTKYATVSVQGGGTWQADSTLISNHFAVSPSSGTSGNTVAITPLSANTGSIIEGGLYVSAGNGGGGALYLYHLAPAAVFNVSPDLLSWTYSQTDSRTVYVSGSGWTSSISGSGFSRTENQQTGMITVAPSGTNTGSSARIATLQITNGTEYFYVELYQGINNNSEGGGGSGGNQPSTTVTPSTLVWSAGETDTRYVTVANTGGTQWSCDSTVYSNHFRINPVSGSMGTSLAVTPISTNASTAPIYGYIGVYSNNSTAELDLIHRGVEYSLDISPESLRWPYDSNIPQNVTVSASHPWTASLSGSGFSMSLFSGYIRITPVGFNESYTPRTGVITLTCGTVTKTVELTQTGMPEPEPPVAMSGLPGQAIPIDRQVTPTGALVCTVPIAANPTSKYAPSLILSYNSQGGNGVAGYGWSVTGLPSISLIPRTKYYDGYSAAADVNGPNPSFALDGVPLVESEEYAAGTTSYPFKTVRGHIRVKRTIAGFEAMYPDGSRAAFGIGEAGPNSSLQVSYPVTEMEDIYGRRMEISYLCDNGMFYPDTIRYDMSNVEPSRIIFLYDNRTDYVDMYYASSPVSMRKLLKSIKSEVDGEELRTYSLVHTERDYVSTLDSLKCTLGDEHLSPLCFSYGVPGQNTHFTQGQTIQLPSAASESPYGKLFSRGKFLQDSYNDGVLITPWYENYGATFTSGDGEHSQCGSLYDAGVRVTLLPDLTQSSEIRSIAVGAGFQEIQALDIDCDGTDEIVKLNFISVVGDSTVLGVTTYKLNTILRGLDSTFFSVKVLGRVNDAGFISPQQRFYRYGVFRQDGSCCLLTTGFAKDHTGADQNGYSALVDLRAGVVLTEEELFEINPGEDYQLFVVDLNGDGISEICHVDEDGMNVYKYDNGHIVLSAIYTDITSSDISDGYHLTDLNGDGLTDIVCMSRTADRWSSFVFTGTGFQKHVSTIARVRDGTQVMFMDLDKDGLNDFVRIDSDGLVECCLNDNGALVMASPASVTIPANSRLLPSNVLSYNGASSIAVENGGMILPYSYGRNVLKKRTMTCILDSFRNKTTVSYSDLSDADGTYYSNRFHYSTGKYVERLVPIAAVKEICVESAGVVAERKRYRYVDIVLSTRGAGLVCFGRLDEKDIIQGTSRQTFNDPDAQGACVEVYEFTGSEFNALRGWGNNIINPVLNNHGNATDAHVVTSSTYESLSGIYSGQSYDYDTLGFPAVVITRKWRDADTTIVKTETKTVTYSHSLVDSLYVLGAVAEKQSYKGSLASKTEYTLDSLNRPTRTKAYVGNVSGSDTTWCQTSDRIVMYDARGNVTSDRLASYGATTYNESTYAYDNAGRYMTASTDPLGRIIEYLNYNKYGQPTQVRDWLGRQTLSTYDTWGDLISKTDPDSTVTAQTISWSASGEPGLYCISKTVTGQPDTKVWYDALGREVRSANKRFDGSWQYVTTQYDERGRICRTSLPYKDTVTGPTMWNTYTYDAYDRPTNLTEATGKQTNWSYSGTSTTMVKDSLVTTSTTDVEGNVVSVTDGGGTITYTLRDDGQPSAVTVSPYGTNQNIVTTFQYDVYGRRTAIIDPSAGTRTDLYTDNSNGSSSVAHTGPNGTVTTYYDRYGRVTSVTRPEFNTSYTYGTTLNSSSYGKLISESSTNGTSRSFTYDALGRTATETEHADSAHFLTKTYTYNATGANLGSLASIAYTTQDGDVTTESFSYANGHNTGIAASGPGNTSINVFTLTSENALGQPTAVTTGGMSRTYGYTASGLPTRRRIQNGQNSVIQDFEYSYEASSGNMAWRKDNVLGMTEYFSYDGFNRLTAAAQTLPEPADSLDWRPYERGALNAGYDSKGNVMSFRGLSMSYDNPADPYQNTSATTGGGDWVEDRLAGLDAGMTSFDRPSGIGIDNYLYASYNYDATGNKVKGAFPVIGVERTYLGGAYERDERSYEAWSDDLMDMVPRTETIQRLFLGGSAYDAPMVMVKEGTGNWTPYNIGRDVLGSITHVATQDGTLFETYYYDAWGDVVPMDGEYNSIDTLMVSPTGGSSIYSKIIGSRGYTGHESIPGLGIYNANARLYDPVTGRFLSPDPLIQDPESTQNFNRYSYCLNNPLKYTDESGEVFWELALIAGHIAGMANIMSHGDEIGNSNSIWTFFKYYGVGFLSGAAGSIVGGAISMPTLGPGFFGAGISSAISGFVEGFISGSGNSLISGAENPFTSGIKNGLTGAASGFFIGGFFGGIDSINHEGNFWTGIGYGHNTYANDIPSTMDKPLVPSNDYAMNMADNNFGSEIRNNYVSEFYADGTLPNKTYYYKKNGKTYYINRKGKPGEILGKCIYVGKRKSNIYIFESAFQSNERLYLTIGHEYLHAIYNSLGLYSDGIMSKYREYYQHASIHEWQYYQAKAWNYDVSFYKEKYDYYKAYLYKNKYNYSSNGFYIIPIKPF